MRKTPLTLVALAAFACVAPAHAQVLGGRGDLTGGLGGAIAGTGGMIGGNFSGNSRIDGRLPAANAIDRLETARERAARRATSQGERGMALAGTLAGAAQGTLQGNDATTPAPAGTQPHAPGLDVAGTGHGAASAVLGRGAQEDANADPGRSDNAPARRPLLPSVDADGSAEGSASASASRESGVSASTGGTANGSARLKRDKANGSGETAAATSANQAPAPTAEPRPATAKRDRKQVDDPR